MKTHLSKNVWAAIKVVLNRDVYSNTDLSQENKKSQLTSSWEE